MCAPYAVLRCYSDVRVGTVHVVTTPAYAVGIACWVGCGHWLCWVVSLSVGNLVVWLWFGSGPVYWLVGVV